jgi:hypothetical protein
MKQILLQIHVEVFFKILVEMLMKMPFLLLLGIYSFL